MLNIIDSDYFNEVKEFAEKVGKEENLKEKLDYLSTFADHNNEGLTRCDLYKDFAPYSFYFVINRKDKDGEFQGWINGGLIFHSSHDGFGSGAAPTLAVTLNPTDGWSIHT